MRRRHDRSIDEAELTALADGSLAQGRRAEIAAQVATSPDLAALLAEQRRAVSIVRGALAGVEAPPALRAARIDADRSVRQPLRARRRLPLTVAFAATAAATALAIALALPSGAGGPSLADAASLGALPAAAGAPRAQPRTPALLDETLDGVAFPRWERDLGWRATGTRRDRLDGRDAKTVFYEKNGSRIAYTVVSGPPLDMPGDADVVRRKGVTLGVLGRGSRVVVTWLRREHACVLSGAGVEPAVLVELASWDGKGAVPF